MGEDYMYEIAKRECQGLCAIYGDYLAQFIGEDGVNKLVSNGLLEPCGSANGRQLYALVKKKES